MAESAPQPYGSRLSIWPPIIILSLMWLAIGWTYLGEPAITEFMVRVMIAPFLALLSTLVWWLFFSQLEWFDKLLVLAFFIATSALVLVPNGVDAMMYAFCALAIAVTAGLGLIILTPGLTWVPRLVGLLVAIALSIGFFGLVRIEGLDGDFKAEYKWRWEPTSEAKLLAEVDGTKKKSADELTIAKPNDTKIKAGDWPAFRGPDRDSRVKDTVIGTDWKSTPPKLLWKHRIGPGWSSFAVVGKQLFTQEQRGNNELVVCYDADNGGELWNYSVPTRFTEAIAGPGPRSTPTYLDGKIYSQGANGHLVCLDAYSGKEIWKKDLREDTGAEPPQWGFSGSPLIHKGIVSVFAGAKDKTLVGYKADTGEIAWTSARETKPELSYCSTHLVTIDGVEQLVILTDRGATAYEPETGKVLWNHEWETNGVVRCVQPAIIDGSDILIGTGLGVGTQRIHVSRKDGTWTITEIWKTTKFKPYYNDMVLYEGFAYGYDGNMFVCVDTKGGEIRWKARGYGSGQTLLLEKQGLLVVLTEKGDVVLVEAKPGAHKELGKVEAIKGKTWNHPVIAHGKLFVRNGEEIACLELPKATEEAAKDKK